MSEVKVTAQPTDKVLLKNEGDMIKGPQGDSAYQIALKHGFKGTEEEWLASLVGAQGPMGPQGPQGTPGVKGVDGKDGHQGVDGKPGKDGEPGPQGPAGKDGKSGVHIGTEAPTDDSNVWIDLDGTPDNEVATKQYVNEMLGVIENGSY